MISDDPLFGPVRRVVTGLDERGKAVFASDEAVDPITTPIFGRTAIHWLYGADAVPGLPVTDPLPAHEGFYPGPGGVRFGLLNLPPATDPEPVIESLETSMADMERKLPNMAAALDPNPDLPGMHRTDSVDALIILSGTVTMELDDGVSTELTAGDTVIQNGTNHRWINTGEAPVTIAYVLCGAQSG